VRNRDE
jgi:hypothetical protein